MRIYGHRGAKGEAPENTLAGFEHAYRHGVRNFELDVQLSSDGKPVVFHDSTLDRTTGRSGRVSSHTEDEILQMDARQGGARWSQPATIPSLETIFVACPEFEHMQLEIKSDSKQRLNILCNRLVEMIQRNQWHERVTLTSRDAWFLKLVRRHSRRIRIGLVSGRRFPNPVKLAQRLDCNFLCCGWKLCSASMVKAAHGADLHVTAWTVNRIHDMLELEDNGVDSVITDFPTSTLMFFENRQHRLIKAHTLAHTSADKSPMNSEGNPA
ncbi:glycerophosphodiester phosphodiesterase [Marinobacteraceae bacterium S3BR75-40.1]